MQHFKVAVSQVDDLPFLEQAGCRCRSDPIALLIPATWRQGFEHLGRGTGIDEGSPTIWTCQKRGLRSMDCPLRELVMAADMVKVGVGRDRKSTRLNSS